MVNPLTFVGGFCFRIELLPSLADTHGWEFYRFTEHLTMATLKELRQEAKDRYQRGQGQKNLKGYGALSKAALLAKLGKSNEEKRDNRAIASTKTANAIASKLASGVDGDKAVKRVQMKARLLRSVKKEIDAARKANPDISQEELRKIAGKAFMQEAKAIKEGKAEVKAKKGGQKVKQAADQKELPKLKGSEKQTAWAEEVRGTFIDEGKDESGFDKGVGAHVKKMLARKDLSPREVYDNMILKHAYDSVLQKDDARFWIDNRSKLNVINFKGNHKELMREHNLLDDKTHRAIAEKSGYTPRALRTK